MQLVNKVDGGQHLATSTGGQIMRIWPDGRTVDDYNRSAPLTATVNGARWAFLYRGVETSHTQTRGGRIYISEIISHTTLKVTRNGKVRPTDKGVASSYDLPYLCNETRLTTYGNVNVSTDSFQRISHTP